MSRPRRAFPPPAILRPCSAPCEPRACYRRHNDAWAEATQAALLQLGMLAVSIVRDDSVHGRRKKPKAAARRKLERQQRRVEATTGHAVGGKHPTKGKKPKRVKKRAPRAPAAAVQLTNVPEGMTRERIAARVPYPMTGVRIRCVAMSARKPRACKGPMPNRCACCPARSAVARPPRSLASHVAETRNCSWMTGCRARRTAWRLPSFGTIRRRQAAPVRRRLWWQRHRHPPCKWCASSAVRWRQ